MSRKFPRELRRAKPDLTACVVACAAVATVAACSGGADSAPPVATPQLTVPAEAAIGSPMEMSYRFVVAAAAPPFAEDYWVFVHFIDRDGELMWTDDHEPPTSTREWTAGSTIEYQRTMFVPKFPYVGETSVEMGLFSPATGDRLPLAGETDGQRAYTAGTFDLRLETDNLFVVFRDGWHDLEASEQGDIEWQWSTKEATLSFRNPRRDVVFYLQADQPSSVFPEPQRVELRLGPAVIDEFTLLAGPRELRRVPITAGQLGADDTVTVTLVVDKTFVPAAVPSLASTDSRELGIRVFRAVVQPKEK